MWLLTYTYQFLAPFLAGVLLLLVSLAALSLAFAIYHCYHPIQNIIVVVSSIVLGKCDANGICGNWLFQESVGKQETFKVH